MYRQVAGGRGVAELERKAKRNDRVLVELIRYLEKRDGRNLDGDGSIG
jgi:hypothetical protein